MLDEKSSIFLHGGMASEAEIQQEYFERGLIYTLQIELTMKCLQGCTYCYANSTPRSQEGLSTDTIMDILDDAAQINIRCIDWLGGDPLARSDWYEIMQYAQKKGLLNNIWSSGLPLSDEDTAKKAVEVTKGGGFISVHLDSLNPEVYRQVHRLEVEENISAILKGVENVLALGKSSDEIWNCITLTKPVAEGDVKNTLEWFWKKKGIRTVLTLYNPTNKSKLRGNLEPTLEKIQQAYKWRDETVYSDGSKSFSTMDVSKFYCASMICITHDGFYTPCSVIRTKEFGNYETLDLKTLLKENPGDILMMRLRDPNNLPESCQNCEQNDVCFGCRSTAYYYTGDMFGHDPKCPKCQDKS
ncbi:MAG: radical SAM/SPASM domain-containing protein [Candidatus Hodarchaeota archaeon]